MNYTGKLNLLKLKNSCIVEVKGKTATKRGVFIPITDNNLYVSADENLKAKGVYMDFNAWENKEIGKYGDTHAIRQALPKEVRDKMTEEELRAVPYVGNMKPFERANSVDVVAASEVMAEDIEELPF